MYQLIAEVYIFHIETFCILKERNAKAAAVQSTVNKRRVRQQAQASPSTKPSLHHLCPVCTSTGLQGDSCSADYTGPQSFCVLICLRPFSLRLGALQGATPAAAQPSAHCLSSSIWDPCAVPIATYGCRIKQACWHFCVYVTVMIAWQETYHILNVLVKIPISMCWHLVV